MRLRRLQRLAGQVLRVSVWLVPLSGCVDAPGDTAHAGQVLFDSYCATCHRYDGQEMGEAPPLDDSPWVAGSAETLIKIVLHGVRGRFEIDGEVYDREMPGIGAVLSDKDVATLLSFVRARFGSIDEPVSVDVVARVRETHHDRIGYWDIEQLRP